MALSLALILGPDGLQASYPPGIGLYPAMIFVGANLIVFLVNLFPRRFVTEEGLLESDGLQLIKLPFRNRDYFNSCVAAHYVALGREHLEQKDYLGARRQFLKGLDISNLEDVWRAHFLNLVAWYDLIVNDSKVFDEALKYATEAVRLDPENAAIKGTVGSLLIETGELDRGLSLLIESSQNLSRKDHQAINLSYIAIAHRRMGKPQQAQEALRQVEELDSNCVLLKRVRQIVMN